jgi:hypothetical protein
VFALTGNTLYLSVPQSPALHPQLGFRGMCRAAAVAAGAVSGQPKTALVLVDNGMGTWVFEGAARMSEMVASPVEMSDIPVPESDIPRRNVPSLPYKSPKTAYNALKEKANSALGI